MIESTRTVDLENPTNSSVFFSFFATDFRNPDELKFLLERPEKIPLASSSLILFLPTKENFEKKKERKEKE